MATVSTVFRKDKLNKKGIAPVNFRVIKDRKIYYVTTDLKLTADEWDEKNKKVKPKHKNSVYWNNWLAAKNADLQIEKIKINSYIISINSNSPNNKIIKYNKLICLKIRSLRIIRGLNRWRCC